MSFSLEDKYVINKLSTDKGEDIYDFCKLVDPTVKRDPLIDVFIDEKYKFMSFTCNCSMWSTSNMYDTLLNHIDKYGTISPSGKIEDTPKNINLKLKDHQKRTLYEMISREDNKYRLVGGNNILMLCDDVGSGKSIEILSLIAKRPIVKNTWNNRYYVPNELSKYRKKCCVVEGYDIDPNITVFNSNLLIIPHNIFNQWIKYIKMYTNLSSYCIGKKKDIISNKKNLYDKLMNSNIVCIKSTMLRHFVDCANENFGITKADTNYVGNVYKNNKSQEDSEKTKYQIIDQVSSIYRKFVNSFGNNPNAKDSEEFILNLNNIIKNIDYNYLLSSQNIQNCETCKKVSTNSSNCNNNEKGYMFQRVIIDEVDSIRVPNFPYIYGKYTWLVTSSINNLLYPRGKYKFCTKQGKNIILSKGIYGSGFIKNTLHEILGCNYTYSSCNYNFNGIRIFKSIVRNNNEFIKDSITIPEPVMSYIKCYTPPEIFAVSDAISKDALKALNAGDIDSVKAILGCSAATETDILDVVNLNLSEERAKYKAKIETKNKKLEETLTSLNIVSNLISDAEKHNNIEFISELTEQKKQIKITKDNYIASIKKWKSKVESVDTKLKGIEERVSGCEKKLCPICATNVVDPSLTPCCRNVFCMKCIGMSLKYSKECPMCRTVLNLKDMKLIVKSKTEEEIKTAEALPKKLDVIIDYILENPKRRVMVFSEYESTFNLIEDSFKKNKINYSRLQGSSDRISNIVNKFKDNEFQVLLLNAKNFGAGLNLQFTDDIYIFHRMSVDLETQVIGRAQRIGREIPLQINYLCYENEYPKNTEFKNNDKNALSKEIDNYSNTNMTTFIKTCKFEGEKIGYVFTTGESGTGYYLDNVNTTTYLSNETVVNTA